MVWYDDPIAVTVVAVVIIIACGTVILAMRQLGRKSSEPKKPQKKAEGDSSFDYGKHFDISKSVPSNTALNAKDELRMLDLEREILSDALRRLYEAQAEGKITEQEREKLAGTYKARMMSIKESISKDETIVALHDLESMQEDLMKLFSERFGELTSKVEELRTRIDVKPIREIPVKLPSQTSAAEMEKIDNAEAEEEEAEQASGEEKQKRKRKPSEEKTDAKTEAEKRIDTIRSEVEKVLDKLGQMEIES
jgi:hypothetical protein